MKEKILNFKSIFYLITLLSIVILCNNFSVVHADSIAPTECRISINNNALYTNNRYVTLDLYGVDADAMQVWISNDGENGTVLDFAYNTTYTITDQNYVVGVALDDTNSTTSTNSDNVLRIENWPLSSVNGTKKVYVVFRDAYGNKTSVSGLNTITISFDLNGMTGESIPDITTVKNLGAYMPTAISDALNKSFTGWSASYDADLPSYSPETLNNFTSDTTLYAICKTIKVGDYLYYDLDSTKRYELLSSTSGTSTQIFDIATKFPDTKQVFKVIASSDTSISISPMKRSQVFNVLVADYAPTNNNNGNIATIVQTICNLYSNNFSLSTAVISNSLMSSVSSDLDFASLFAEYGYTGGGTYDENYNRWVYASRIGSYNAKLQTVQERSPKTVSAYVYPVITLKTNVRFSGTGTITSPYTLSPE